MINSPRPTSPPRLEINKKGRRKSRRLPPLTLTLPPRSGLPTCQPNISPNIKLNKKPKRRKNQKRNLRKKKRRPMMKTRIPMTPMMTMMSNNRLTTCKRKQLRERRLQVPRKLRRPSTEHFSDNQSICDYQLVY